MKNFLLSMTIAVVLFGAGAAYAHSAEMQMTNESDIDQVTNVLVKEKFKKKVVLQWTAVDGANSYQVRLMNKHKKKLRTLSADTVTKTIKSLTAGKKYKVRVRAIVNDKVEGPWSDFLTFTTKNNEDDTNNNDTGDDAGDGLEITTEAIAIEDFAFSPDTLTIAAGSTVTWTNNDSSAHTVTSDDGEFLDSGTLVQGDTYTVTFDTPGTYTYICAFHTSMAGMIIVE